MKLSILKDFLQEKIFNAQKFTLSKTSSVPLLQNGLIQVFDKKIAITTTNLNDFFYTELKNDTNEEKNNVVDIKKIGEYLSKNPPKAEEAPKQDGEIKDAEVKEEPKDAENK